MVVSNMSKSGTDCKNYFKAGSNCKLGEQCLFRHEPAALHTSEECRDWLRQKKCDRQHCKFRHPSMKEHRRIVCYDWLRNECHRENCQYEHLPRSQPNEASMKRKLTHMKEQHRYDPLKNAYAQIVAKGINPDNIFDVNKEPIKVNLELHEKSPDRRNIQQATIPEELLGRKIIIPKHPTEYTHSSEGEDVYIKTYDEICRERELQLKLHLAKMKYAKRLQGKMDIDEYNNGRYVTLINHPLNENTNDSQYILEEPQFTNSAIISPVRPPLPQQNNTNLTSQQNSCVTNSRQPTQQDCNTYYHDKTDTVGNSAVHVKSEYPSYQPSSVKSRLTTSIVETTPPRLVSTISSNTSEDSDFNMSLTSVKSEPEFQTPPPLIHTNYDEDMPVLEIYADPDSDQQLINELNTFIQ